MENSGNILFQNDTKPQWYVATGTSQKSGWIGPMTASDVYEKIGSGEITWAHYAWKKGQADWQRLCEIPAFQAAVPGAPSREIQKEIKHTETVRRGPPPPPKKKADTKKWFLHYNDSQFGPFSGAEVCRYLEVGKINGRVHAWAEGMENWLRLEKIEEFDEAVSASKKARATQGAAGKVASKSKGASGSAVEFEQRTAPRRPLVAKIVLAHEDSVITAVCRDISIGGMQVLTDRVPGKPGGRLKLNVSPAGDERGGRIDPFVAEGVIVRLLEDGRGFSFRFERLPESAKRAIENYIAGK